MNFKIIAIVVLVFVLVVVTILVIKHIIKRRNEKKDAKDKNNINEPLVDEDNEKSIKGGDVTVTNAPEFESFEEQLNVPITKDESLFDVLEDNKKKISNNVKTGSESEDNINNNTNSESSEDDKDVIHINTRELRQEEDKRKKGKSGMVEFVLIGSPTDFF